MATTTKAVAAENVETPKGGRPKGDPKKSVAVRLPEDVYNALDEYRWDNRIEGGVAGVLTEIATQWVGSRNQ